MKEQYLAYLLTISGGGGSWIEPVNDFATRVAADGGTYEGDVCAKNAVKFLIQNP